MRKLAIVVMAFIATLSCLAISGCNIRNVVDEENGVKYRVFSEGVLEIDIEEVHDNEVICSIRDDSKNVDLAFTGAQAGSIIVEVGEMSNGEIGCEFFKTYPQNEDGTYPSTPSNEMNFQSETKLVKFVFDEDKLGDWDTCKVYYSMVIESSLGDSHEGGSSFTFKRKHVN